ncbi:hypothetical protein LB505_005454 [Fusarium chuoi]|nr:hypothetical protein LB505_005454 [Fusarium chuoi]
MRAGLRSGAQLLAQVQPFRLAAGATIIVLIHPRDNITIYAPLAFECFFFNASRAFSGFKYDNRILDQHIRLIHLSDSASGSSPSLKLHTFKLDECPPYIALSYT